MGSGSMEMFEAAAAEERISRRLMLAGMARVLGIVAATLIGYFLLPIEGELATTAGQWGACIGIAIILVVFARQISRVSRSRRPVIAAVEALVLVFGLFLCLFALLYVSISTSDPGAFSQDVDKVAGIYFTTTVLTTVGFGDISPVSGTARVMVTVQMVLGMVLIGTAFKALGFSAKRAVTARNASVAADPAQSARAQGNPGSGPSGG
jgi:voltage-gated potassium channel